MGLSTNGQSCVPPGFRFHPTEEELVSYYLRKKVSYETIDLDVIRDVDLNKLEPWDLHERCKIGSAPQNEWYFFSHKDKKYPTGTRTNRATTAGFWKATGRDKAIYMNFNRIGMRKTLVFYTGRAPHGQKTEWIMHEYRLDDNENPNPTGNEDAGWVVCRVFKKRIHHKDMVGSQFPTTNYEKEQSVDPRLPRLDFPCEDHSRQLDLMPKQCKPKYGDHVFIQMPQLQSPEGSGSSSAYKPSTRHFIPERLLDNSSSTVHEFHMRELMQPETDVNGFREDWTVLNSLVNQQAEAGKHQVRVYNGVHQALNGYSSHTSAAENDYAGTEIDYWNYVR